MPPRGNPQADADLALFALNQLLHLVPPLHRKDADEWAKALGLIIAAYIEASDKLRRIQEVLR